MTAFRYRLALVAGLLPAVAAVSAPPVPTPSASGGPVPTSVAPTSVVPTSAAPAVAAPATATPSASDPLDALVKDSPFLPAAAGATASGQTGPLELRSIIMDRGEYFFSLYDLNSKESFWVGLNETGFPALVRNYDRNTETVTVEQQGRTLSLTLAAARTMAANPAAVPQQQPGAPNGPGVAAGGNPPGGGPTVQPSNGQPQFGPVPSTVTPDEAQRLQRIADEIRRRRAVGKIAPSNAPIPAPAPSTPPKS